MMLHAHQSVARWLGQSGQSNSRIEALYQAMEDQDMPAIRAMMVEMWEAATDAAGCVPVGLGVQKALGDGA